jgi:hypothetical protein
MSSALKKDEEKSPDHYISTLYSKVDAMNVAIFPGLSIDFSSIWSVL